MSTPTDPLALADWRRTIAEMYAAVRHTEDASQPEAWRSWRARRDGLFRNHAQSPLDAGQRKRFASLPYFPYDPAWRVRGAVEPALERETLVVDLGADGMIRYTRVARVRFQAGGHAAALSLFWIEGYGGGLFLPFGDATNGALTYGGGRYLYDAIKGADLGAGDGWIALDFNYAYNPSCAYNPRWVCPLSPPGNRLPFAVSAGEKILG